AGFLRTRAGERAGNFAPARALEVRGPLLRRDGRILYPAPADAVPYRETDSGPLRLMRLRPFSPPAGAGCDNPSGMLPLAVDADLKPEEGYRWWDADAMSAWLADEEPRLTAEPGPPLDERVHVAVKADTGTAEDGRLFSTRMVAFERWNDTGQLARFDYLVRVAGPDGVDVPRGPGAFGGERRLAVIEDADGWPACRTEVARRLAGAPRVRAVLATPALFNRGWMPGWLDRTTREGTPPGLDGLTLRLVAAAVPRRQAVSGWDFAAAGRQRPKPVRWLAPAGAVYFFEVVDGEPAVLAERAWLTSISDLEFEEDGTTPVANNRLDGFGLALWGTWNPKDRI
ncbi:MAG: type III-B CRISPR module-associated Cmr3 family protein, partial [Fimbriimonadaceae bacterium]